MSDAAEITVTRTPLPILLLAIVPTSLVIAAVALQPWWPPDHLLKDSLSAARHAGEHCCGPHLGAVSNLGILLWSGTTASCLIGGLIVCRARGWRGPAAFLLSAAAISGWLALDDTFLIHESIIPRWTGWSEKAVVASYVGWVAAHVWFFRGVIARLDAVLLALSLTLFAVSTITDVLFSGGVIGRRVVEDGAKFVGIGAWTLFHLRAIWLMTDAGRGPGYFGVQRPKRRNSAASGAGKGRLIKNP